MSNLDSDITQALAAIALLVLGATLKFAFDRWGAQLGWSREDRRAQDGKIERIDSHARAEVSRIERELGGRLGSMETEVRVLCERVENLPTADDMQALDRRLADVDRGLSGVVSKVDGMGANVKTILQHILAGERRG